MTARKEKTHTHTIYGRQQYINKHFKDKTLRVVEPVRFGRSYPYSTQQVNKLIRSMVKNKDSIVIDLNGETQLTDKELAALKVLSTDTNLGLGDLNAIRILVRHYEFVEENILWKISKTQRIVANALISKARTIKKPKEQIDLLKQLNEIAKEIKKADENAKGKDINAELSKKSDFELYSNE